jgi:peptidoglycan/LPS O-acetylase OafA/YrhL
VAPLLTNPLLLYLGRISYGLYLSHILVIIIIQYALLTWVPDLSRMVHCGVLLAGITVVTIAVSTVLYRDLEISGNPRRSCPGPKARCPTGRRCAGRDGRSSGD